MGYSNSWKFSTKLNEIADYKTKMMDAIELFKEGMAIIGNRVSYNKETRRYDFAKGNAEDLPLVLAGRDGMGEPIFTVDKIHFNGDVNEGGLYDDFFIKSECQLEFCKTNRLPYDVAVCLMLYCIKRYFGKDFSFINDGNAWECGRGLARKVMNRLTKGK